MKDVFVATGGDTRFYELMGQADYLIRELGLRPTLYSGTSAGALLTAFLAQARAGTEEILVRLNDMKGLAFGIKSYRDIFEKQGPARYFDAPGVVDDLAALLKYPSVYSNEPLRRLVRRNISPTHIRDSGNKLRIGTYCFDTQRHVFFSESDRELLSVIIASTAYAPIFPPELIHGMLYGDGGTTNIAPLSGIFKYLKSQSIEQARIHVLVSGPLKIHKRAQPQNAFDLIMATLDALTKSSLMKDIEIAQLKNQMIEGGIYDGVKAELYIYAPEEETIQSLNYDPAVMRLAFESGRETAKKGATWAE